ncbi:MAG: nucleotide exchange factor GrpE, partial [Brevibacterium aurantiacum]|nr:nucleotide exchange factor GrpE [Brevibacterium aurantiacum]
MTSEGNDPSSEEPGFTFSDKRRIDPDTGELRPEADSAAASAETGEADVANDATGAAGAEDVQGADEDLADASDLGVDIPADASTLNDTEAAEGEEVPEPA